MALSITSITPAEGVTAGKDRITIEGTDFDIHPFPPATTGFIGDSLGASVTITFDGQLATDVWVYPKPSGAPGETIIECTTPRYVGAVSGLPADVDVVVSNLITPASVTSVDGFKYRRESAITNSDLTLLTHALLSELDRQIPADIITRTHTDYDDATADGLNIVKIAQVPAIIVEGPTLVQPEGIYFNRNNIQDTGAGDPLLYKKYRSLIPWDATYSLTIIDKSTGRLLNFVSMVTRFVENNGTLKVPETPGTPDDGFCGYDMDWAIPPSVDQGVNNDNLSTASASIIVRGVTLERTGGVEKERAVETDTQGVVIETEKL